MKEIKKERKGMEKWRYGPHIKRIMDVKEGLIKERRGEKVR